ncbi:MAG: excinuclease ABC subunit UvrA [Planctomycetota bacterium]|jgi:excinuclease ABC subunit A|nr:excinuclease ABC subunit UvrA [Planctomycetota bacterium]
MSSARPDQPTVAGGSQGVLRIRGARQHNLAGVDLDLPRERLVAVTGLSGSGKSSLAFDTLFREGQRRFLETLSAYARQFLGRMEKPDVDAVEGLSPTIAVDQKSIARGSRSTVGTLTEIVDHLRVLYARAGRAHCPGCRLPVRRQTPEAIVAAILTDHAALRVQLLAPVVRGRKGAHRKLLGDLRRSGLVRARIDGELCRLEDVEELERYRLHTVEAVVDRLKPDPEQPARLREAVDAALELGDGDLVLLADGAERAFSIQRCCPGCGEEVPPLEPRLFSFNSPHGACPGCEGLGFVRRATERAVVRDSALSLREGALAVTRASGGALLFPRVDFAFLERVGASHGFDLDTPWKQLSEQARARVLHGTGDERFPDSSSWSGRRFRGNASWKRRFRGVLPALLRAQDSGGLKRMARRFLAEEACADCEGSRLRPAPNAVLLGETPLADLVTCPVATLPRRLDALSLEPREARIARDLLAEVRRRVDFLLGLSLGYLTLSRRADSLSGGEAQRIRLAAQLGAGLQGVTYVLDEPSIGLHARDQAQLLDALRSLRDGGNSVLVVEHDEATLRAADYLVDVGPGAGRDGGRIVACGTPAEVARADSPTGRLLRGELEMPAPAERRAGRAESLVVRGAGAHNLADIDVAFPLGRLVAVTGVSGSGKSTLVDGVLRRSLERHLGREAPPPLAHEGIDGLDLVDELVVIDASPIGRTPRSNPATYTGALGPIRDLFASLPESKLRGYTRSRFSFNVSGGRCETCQGAGSLLVELQFLAPVTVTCEDCGGGRFQDATLDVRYDSRSIADVLDLTIDEALELFADHPRIARPLTVCSEIGVGYLTLGQPSTTLSGGEAQRVKLARELSRRPRRHTLYLLDEPTIGLHAADVARLLAALQALVDRGHTVVVVEHDLSVVWAADHVIDLGPEGGDGGGRVLVEGSPEEVLACAASHTGRALCAAREAGVPRAGGGGGAPPGTAPDRLRVVGARTHNLRGLSVDLPREALTVITGRSGSGKTSLALDTIHAEGRRRFVESLSTYARQFLGARDRPPVERIDGLGPSVAVEARTARGGPRSTVATTTEIHDHLRVLWARAGTARCPEHGQPLERADASTLARRILRDCAGERGWVLAPIQAARRPLGAEGGRSLAEHVDGWRGAGFVRVLLDGEELRFEDLPRRIGKRRTLDLVVDRLVFEPGARARLAEAIEGAEAIAGGRVAVLTRGGSRSEHSTRGSCTECGFLPVQAPQPRHFSFNTHAGACPACDGLGERLQCSEELLISAPQNPLREGAIEGKLSRYLVKGKGYYEQLLREVARSHRIDLARPWRSLTPRQRALLARGIGARENYAVSRERHTAHADVEESFHADWPGLCGHVDAWYLRAEDAQWAETLEAVMIRTRCRACDGRRLRAESAAVTVARKRLPELTAMTVDEVLAWLERLTLRKDRREAVAPVIEELCSRLELLVRVGLGYLTLDRATATLSGGEARRVRLSASLGSRLVGVCYVLDEPTVGLHPRDVEHLIAALHELRDGGNTVLVVEHDPAVMEAADWIVDLGPGAGEDGGRLVCSGTPGEVRACAESPTGAALRGELQPERAPRTGGSSAGRVRLRGATTHNLRKVDLDVRYGELLGICGPSGSGKSSLVMETLVPALRGDAPSGRWRRLEALRGGGGRVVCVDASPLGRTPASTPATYSGLLEPLRALYARTPQARMRGFGPAHFSYNSSRGRCAACEGRGAEKIEMQFLPDLWLTCEECDGRRYRPEVLEITHRGRSVADVLAMDVDSAAEFLEHQRVPCEILTAMREVGLGYLRLGQSSTTLSGGEAQRLKLCAELLRGGGGAPRVIVMDEPTIGLHGADVVQLVSVLDKLVRRGDAVVVIEHNVGLLSVCDRLVEIGPGGGSDGGRVIADGTPGELALDPTSLTGPFLSASLRTKRRPRAGRRRKKGAVG